MVVVLRAFFPAFLVGKNPLLGPLNELALLENYTPTPNRAARFFPFNKILLLSRDGETSLDSQVSLVGMEQHTTPNFLGSNPDP